MSACSDGDGARTTLDGDWSDPAPLRTFAEPLPAHVRSVPSQLPDRADYVAATGIVMRRDGRTEICVGNVAESYPPQCGGPPVRGLEIEQLPGYVDVDGLAFTDRVRIIGSYDSASREVTAVNTSSAPRGWTRHPDDRTFDDPLPCTPVDGLPTTAPAGSGDDPSLAVHRYLAAHRDVAAGSFTSRGVMVVQVADDPADHQAAIAALVPGRSCVARVDWTLEALEVLQQQTHPLLGRFGLVGSDIDILNGRVDLHAELLDTETLRAIDRALPPGVDRARLLLHSSIEILR